MLIALAVIVGLVLLISLICYIKVFYSPLPGQSVYSIPNSGQYQGMRDRMREMIKVFAEKDYESVEIISRDGLKLRGRLYLNDPEGPVDICFHGYRSNGVRDFCGGSEISFELNHNIILVDQRGQGESEGHTICFGIKERFDVLSWIDYASCRFGDDREINLFGVSMGAATVLMASGLELPENVKHIVADCPYSSPADIIKTVCTDMHLPATLVYPFIRLGAFIFGRFDLEKTSAAEAVKKASVPILLIHGEDDRFVPCAMSSEIKMANPSLIELVTFPNAAHGISYIVDRERYRRIAKEFIAK